MNKLKDKSRHDQQRIALIKKVQAHHSARRNRNWPVNSNPKNISLKLENNESNADKLLALISENKPENLELIKESLSKILGKTLMGLGLTSKELTAVDLAQKFIRDMSTKL